MIPKEHILGKLYYEIGKQATDFALQHSHKEGEETIWTKRRTFLEISQDPEANKWFIQHCNHRQILKNEIILDFDRPINREAVMQDYDVQRVAARLQEDEWRFIVYHTGSKGVHIHVYNNWLIPCTKERREDFRTAFLKNYFGSTGIQLLDIDFQKASDKTMIALEHVPHWKTGIEKVVVYQYDPDEEVGIWIAT